MKRAVIVVALSLAFLLGACSSTVASAEQTNPIKIWFQNENGAYETLQVVDAIMGSGMSSRLFNRLRDEQGLAYQVGSVFVPNVNSGLFAVFIGTNPKTALHSKNEMFKQIDILKKEFVADKELREAKDKILGNFILSQETNAEKAATIGWFEASGRGFDFIDKYPSIIESVTAGDIIRVANKYFNTNKVVITVVVPDEYLKQF